jgi:urate oxidase
MVYLAEDRYGKSRVRLMKVIRNGSTNELKDWTLSVLFRGQFDKCFIAGDNSMILPTDTMKNTVYSIARRSSATSMEAFAAELAQYFLENNSQVSEVRVDVSEKSWTHVPVDGHQHPTTFLQRDQELQTTRIILPRGASVTTVSGFTNLVILKTAGSRFEGFIKDKLTTLRETDDRLFGTEIACRWTYAANEFDFEAARVKIRQAILKKFAEHHSLSVQHTLFAVGEAVLEQNPGVEMITLEMPNRHCLLVDLSVFGQDNPNEIFVPTDEPHGYIEATVRR